MREKLSYMKGFCFIVAVLVIMFACGSSKEKPEAQKKPIGTKCYQYTDGRDSILLSFQEENSLILGELEYRFAEKDRNSGGIRGMMIGDTIFAEYDFYSEGKKSTREVAFLKKDSVLLEGFGKTTMVNDREMFVDKKTLQYDSKIYLSEVECP